MSTNKKINPIVTPTGSAMWAKITEPQTSQFNPVPMYSMNVIFKPEEVAELKTKLQQQLDEFYDVTLSELKPAKQKSLQKADIFREEEDREGNLTGNLEMRTKQYAKDFKGNDMAMPIVDSKGKLIEDCPLVGNGSKVRAKVYPKPYYMASSNTVGITLRLNGVQIIDLIEYGNASSGFDAVDGGYVAPANVDGNTDEVFASDEDLDF